MTENTKKKKKLKKKTSKTKKFFKYFFLISLFLIITVFMMFGGYVYSIINNAPPLDVTSILKLNQPTILLDDKGEFMDNVITEEQRFVVTSDVIPDNLKNAFISIEDERFYTHKGIDVKRIVGAMATNFKNKLSGKSGIHGASTLTQQLLKNTVLTNEVSINRKVKEMFLALNLEENLSKDEILTAYLNTIPMGGHQYGVEAAATRFFSKNVKDLSLIECAYLAGLTQAPTSYDALSDKNKKDPSTYLNRTKTVLQKMRELQYITQEEYSNAISDLDNGNLTFNPSNRTQEITYEWFTRPAITQVKEDLKNKYKYSDEEVNKLIINGGLKIYTTMDKDLQNNIQEIIDDPNNFKEAFSKTKGSKETLKNNVPELQAAASIIDYRSGQVKALVGGRGEQKPKSLNRAYNDLRPTGSSSKPLTVYAPTIDLKIMGAGSVINDSPFGSDFLKKYHYKEQPQNENRQYRGYLTLREALKISDNVAALKIVDEVGLKNALEYGRKFGLIYNNESANSLSALALGQFDNSPSDRDGGNVYKMANAFGAFGNNGIMTESKLYTRVEDASGKVILEANPEQINVISPQTAYILYDMLKEPVNASARAAKFSNIPAAGKTGTTSDNKDYWFSGLTPYYSAAVWIGYDMPTTMRGWSGKISAPLWGKIMSVAHKGLEYKEIESPSGISKVAVCKDSGHLPTSLCNADPRGSRVYSDYFIEGSAPNQLCSVHVKATINSSNGKLANNNTPPSLIQERVFITKPNYYSGTHDAKYVLPTSQDNTAPQPIVEPDKPAEPENTENTKPNTNEDKNIPTDTNQAQKPNTENNTKPNSENNTKPNSENNTKPNIPNINTDNNNSDTHNDNTND